MTSLKSCYEELERINRILVEQKVDKLEIPFFVKSLKSILATITQVKVAKQTQKDAKASGKRAKAVLQAEQMADAYRKRRAMQEA